MLIDSDTTARGYFGATYHIKVGSHVLDVGGSTGVFAATLYDRTGQDGVTVSLPLSIEVVGFAEQNLTTDGVWSSLAVTLRCLGYAQST